MTTPLSPMPSARRSTYLLYWLIVGGLVAIVTVFTVLFQLGVAPLLEGEITTVVAYILAAAALGPLLFGWARARPRVPTRPRTRSLDAYWDENATKGRALILWVLWEGAAILAAVGTLLTGSYVPAGVGVFAFALLLAHRPGVLEEREQ